MNRKTKGVVRVMFMIRRRQKQVKKARYRRAIARQRKRLIRFYDEHKVIHGTPFVIR